MVCNLQGFFDASLGAFAAVVYLKIETPMGCSLQLVASNTRVAPICGQTISKI